MTNDFPRVKESSNHPESSVLYSVGLPSLPTSVTKMLALKSPHVFASFVHALGNITAPLTIVDVSS